MANIDNLNFGVILNDDDFNRKIEEDIEAAKRFNVQLSSLLDAKAKMPQFKVSVKTKEAEDSLENLNAKFAELEAADWTKVGKKLDVTHQVEQALIQLRNLEEEIEVIQEIRQEKGGDMGLALELKKAQEQADRLIASISALREAEKAVNAPSQFQAHIRSLTEQSMEYKQLVEYMKAEEAAAAEVAKEKAKEEAARQKNAKAIEKERAAMAKGEFKEYIESLTAANPTLKQMSTYYKELEKETAKNANAAKGAAVHQKRLNDQFKVTSRLGREVKNALIGIFSVHEASKLVSSLVRVTGEFELQKTTLAAMLGDLNKAEQIITRIQGLAVESPFQFKELTTYAKQLSAFSVPAEELYETTKMLADVSAGLGVGMDRIVLAYGQVRSAAFLRGQEVRQFTEAGIPILDELAKQFTELEGRAVSTGEVFDKISARLVPFEMVAKVFKDMTSEGGKFYQMQEVQAETLRGKISNLKDAYEVMLNEIGSSQTEKLKGAVDWARKLMQNYEKTGKVLLELVVTYGIYKATLIALELATQSFTRANHKLIETLVNAGKYLVTNPYVALAAAIVAVGYATYKWVTYQTEAEKIQERLAKSHQDYTEALSKEYAVLNSLYAKLELYTEGTLEHDKAKAQLMRKYSTYIEQLRQEGVEVNNLADIYVNLAEKIKESMQAKFYDSATQGLDQAYKDAQERTSKKLAKDIEAAKKIYGEFSEKDKLALNLYVLGGIDEDKAFGNMSEAARKYFTDYKVFLTDQRKSMKEATDAYMEGLDEISDAYQTFQKENEKPPINLTKFAESVQSVLKSFGASEDNKGIFGHLWADNKTEYYDYLKNLREGYEDIKQKIKDVGTTQKDNLPDLEKQKKAIESIAKALGVSLDKGDYGKGKSKAQIDLETQIDLVKKLQDAYDKLRPYVDDKTMKSTLSKFFPDAKQEWIDSLDFSEILRKMADELEKYNEEAAERLRSSVGKDMAGDIASAFKAVEQYKKALESWMGEDFNLTGEGVSFDISKIVRDMNNQIAKVNQKAIQASELLTKAQMGDEEALKVVREVYGEEVWEKYLINGQKTIDELAKKEREAAKRTADEKIRDLADKFVKEQMDKKNIDLSDMEDKSVAQIQALIDRMKEIQEEAQKLAGESLAEMFMGKIDEGQYAQWQMLLDVIDQLRQKIDDAEEELNDKILDTTLDGIDAISKLGGEIASLGEAVGNSDLAKLGQTMERTAQAASGIIKALEADDTISLISNIVSYAITSITDVFAAAYKQQNALNEATEEYRQLLLDIRRETYSGVFGTDEIGLAAENAKILAEAQKQYEDALSKFEDEKKLRRNKYTDTTAFKKKSVADILNEIADLQGWSLYDEAGELDLEALKANYDVYYDHLTNKQKEVVDAVIAGYNAQDEAARHSAEYLTELFSDVADNIAENMIDAFLESGDAAIDMGDVISDVSRKMVADLIKSIYLMPILNSYKKQFDAIESDQSLSPTEKTEAHLRNLDSALYEISNKSDEITAALEGFEEYFGSGETGTKDLGESIQGITEDQANLLASYLNAIRADVSSSKAIWSRMDGNLQRIADMFASSPTLMEYQAQIAANTYNTAIATQEILGELRSVITTDSGDTAIRVYS